MARPRPPAIEVNADLDGMPPNWAAHWVWVFRWGDEHMGGPTNRAQNFRTIFAAGPVEPALDRVQRWWDGKGEGVRRRCWEQDGHRPGSGTEHCRHHDQAVAFCEQTCPTVAAIQRHHDDAGRHYWNGVAP